MGSIEVFDCQQGKWVPYVSTPEDVERYYQQMLAEINGKKKPGVLESKLRHMEDQLKETQQKLEAAETELKQGRTLTVKQVTPVAQAIEIAKAEVAREQANGTKKRKYVIDWSKQKF